MRRSMSVLLIALLAASNPLPALAGDGGKHHPTWWRQADYGQKWGFIQGVSAGIRTQIGPFLGPNARKIASKAVIDAQNEWIHQSQQSRDQEAEFFRTRAESVIHAMDRFYDDPRNDAVSLWDSVTYLRFVMTQPDLEEFNQDYLRVIRGGSL